MKYKSVHFANLERVCFYNKIILPPTAGYVWIQTDSAYIIIFGSISNRPIGVGPTLFCPSVFWLAMRLFDFVMSICEHCTRRRREDDLFNRRRRLERSFVVQPRSNLWGPWNHGMWRPRSSPHVTQSRDITSQLSDVGWRNDWTPEAAGGIEERCHSHWTIVVVLHAFNIFCWE